MQITIEKGVNNAPFITNQPCSGEGCLTKRYMKYKHYPERIPAQILTAPFIYGMIFPFIFLDICLEIYHRVSFPLYGIPLVNRWKYIRIDRHKLPYLSLFNKINCAYCGYGNGLLQYACVIAGETEKYWCGIKHASTKGFVEPEHHKEFLPYGDKEAYKSFVEKRESCVLEKDQTLV